jgi:hypothetical protein
MSGRPHRNACSTPAAARYRPQPIVKVGSIAGGGFRSDRVLGRGGMGMVCVATHLQLEQQVALRSFTMCSPATPRSLLRRLPPPRHRAMRQRCAREGVLL